MEVKKYTGFTLIELLAVIVILAVIALIATPIIMNVINEAKEGAAKDSMYSYVKAVELDATRSLSPDTDLISGAYTTKDGDLYDGDTKVLDINMKGTKPTDNSGTITLVKGQVTNAILKFGGYDIEYKNSESGEYKPKEYTVGEEVYFDPIGVVTDCVSGKEWTLSNTSTTCYKWNVIKDNGSNIEMLLDHNTSINLKWITKEDYIASGGTEAEYGGSGNNKYGPVTIIKQLKIDTNGWSKVETLTSADSVTRDNGSSGTYIIDYNGMKARLISGQEIANIANLKKWTPKSWDMSISAVPWLYQNLGAGGSGYDSSYWTDTARPDNVYGAWNVISQGNLDATNSSIRNGKGVKPIVRVLKSNI